MKIGKHLDRIRDAISAATDEVDRQWSDHEITDEEHREARAELRKVSMALGPLEERNRKSFGKSIQRAFLAARDKS